MVKQRFQFGRYLETFRKRLKEWYAHQTLRSSTGTDFYFIYIAILIAYFFLQWPIVAFDTDLWTHLNGGRYIIEQGRIPNSSFYSFLSPERTVSNYTWLFKAFIFKIYSFSGYYGLIFLRTIIALATTFFIYAYLRKNQSNGWLPVIFILFFLVFIDSSSDIRPYNFSYLFIVIFLFVLEYHPRKSFILPILAVVWLNLHGIEYPVLILILSSYLAEYVFNRFRTERPLNKKEYYAVITLVLSMSAIFVTPHGLKLIEIPFKDISYTPLYIDELGKIEPGSLFSFHLNALVPDYYTIVHLFIIISFTLIFINTVQWKGRISHFLLFAGGIFLLSKGIRFIHEFALLAMPLLQTKDFFKIDRTASKLTKLVFTVCLAALIIFPFFYLKSLFAPQPNYPLATDNLPHGNVLFLNKIGARGKVFNYPATGGYMAWMLWPDCKIYMDMQVPFPFTDEDYFKAVSAAYDPPSFHKMIKEHQPDFIMLPLRSNINKYVIRRVKNYAAVFFDDSEVVYVDRKQHPTVAKKYELKTLNPSALPDLNINAMDADKRNKLLKELHQLVQVYPTGRVINGIMAMYHHLHQDYDKAVYYSDIIIENFPAQTDGYLRKADALLAKKEYRRAIGLYEAALAVNGGNQNQQIHKNLWACYFGLQEYHKAYTALKKAVNFFAPSASYMDLYNFSLTAYRVEKITEARMLLRFAAYKVPEHDSIWKARIAEMYKLLEEIASRS